MKIAVPSENANGLASMRSGHFGHAPYLTIVELSDDFDILSVESAAAGMNKMRQRMLFYRRAYEDSSQNALWKYMLEYFADRYTRLAKEKLGVEQLDTQVRYSIRLFCYGTVGMTREWVLQDNITPAEVIVRMMFASMPESLRQIYGL